ACSMTAGFVADRFSKRSVTCGVKVFEIHVMFLALTGLATNHLYLTISCVFLMGVHSAIFGPSKYGLLPELLPERRLSWGNGILELGTFLAIITGMAAGAVLYDRFKGREVWSGAVLMVLAAAGLVLSLGITRVPAADPLKKFQANFLGDLWRQIQLMRRDRVLWLACLGNTYFWFIGQLLQQSVVDYGENVLKIGELRTTWLLAALAIGIGLGSFAAGYLSGGKIEYGLVPLGSLGLSAFAALLWHPALTPDRNPGVGTTWEWLLGSGLAEVFPLCPLLAVVAALGFFGGFFIVPISAILQHRPDKERKGAVLAAANLLSSAGLF